MLTKGPLRFGPRMSHTDKMPKMHRPGPKIPNIWKIPQQYHVRNLTYLTVTRIHHEAKGQVFYSKTMTSTYHVPQAEQYKIS